MRNIVLLYSPNLPALYNYIEIADTDKQYHKVVDGLVIPRGFNSGVFTKDGINGLLVAALQDHYLYGFISHLIAEGYLEALATIRYAEDGTILTVDEDGNKVDPDTAASIC